MNKNINKNINISPALMNDIYKVLQKYGYEVKSAFWNKNQGNKHYLFNNELIEIELKIKNKK